MPNVTVDVYDRGTGKFVTVAGTENDGTYTALGLPPGTAYTVCFDGSNAGDPAVTAYRSQCWNAVPWDGNSAHLPSAASPVTVSGGQARTNVNAALRVQ